MNIKLIKNRKIIHQIMLSVLFCETDRCLQEVEQLGSSELIGSVEQRSQLIAHIGYILSQFLIFILEILNSHFSFFYWELGLTAIHSCIVCVFLRAFLLSHVFLIIVTVVKICNLLNIIEIGLELNGIFHINWF